MNTPQPPDTDEEVQRHKFYGSLSAAIECIKDKMEANEAATKHNHTKLFENHYKCKELIEQTNGRVNKRTYSDDFEKLEDQVHVLETKEVAHGTAWATGKTFIIGAWIVFTLLSGWGYSMLKMQISDYVKTINENEATIVKMEHRLSIIESLAAEHKTREKQLKITLEDIKESQDYNRQKSKELWKLLNRINLEREDRAHEKVKK